LYLGLSCLPPWRAVSISLLCRAVEVQVHVRPLRLITTFATFPLPTFPTHPPITATLQKVHPCPVLWSQLKESHIIKFFVGLFYFITTHMLSNIFTGLALLFPSQWTVKFS
jgi:hypothetical protein